MTVRRILAALVLTATASLGLAVQPATAATPAATSPAALVVAPDNGGIVRSGQALGVSLTVTNTGTSPLAVGRIAISLDQAPVASTTALLTRIAAPEQVLLGQLTTATATVPQLQPGADVTVRARIAEDDLSTILTGASGARILYARYRSGTGAGTVQTVAESSVVRIGGGSGASVGFGTVIPIVAPAGTTGVVEPATQLQLAGPDGSWSRALRAARADPAATIALDPAVLASIRLAGQAAPPEAAAFLDALGRLPNPFVELPYADADVTLERAAGAKSVLRPSSFAGVPLAPAVEGGPTPDPTTDAGTAASAEDLTAWNWSDLSVAWPVPHTTGAADLVSLQKAKATVLLPSDDVRDTPVRRAAGPLARIGSTRVLVANATASSLLATAGGDGPAGDAALATLTGLLATAAVTGETTAVLTTVDRSGATPRLDRVLSLLGRQPWIRSRPLPDLAAAPSPAAVSLLPHAVAPARVGVARSLLSGEHDVQELGKAIPADADTVTAPQRLALLGMLSAAWRADDAGWRSSAATVERQFDRVVGAVHLTKGSTTNFVGSDGKLRIYVVNELPTPVTVVVHGGVSNARVRFTGDSAATITVPANATQKGDLPFRTITNGRTDLTLQLTTPNGTPVGKQIVRPARVTAGFDTIVAAVLLVALGLLLALGVYRNIKRRGKPRTAAA